MLVSRAPMPLRMLPRHDYSYSSLALQRDFPDVPPSSGPASTASTASSTENHAEEWQARYERLCEAHKRLQRNNIALEEKLLVLNDKFQADKNILSRDLASQTQKVVEAKLSIQHLNRENVQLKSDLKVALNLLQMRPSSFVAQKLSSLPEDLQGRVKQYAADRQEEKRGQRITVAVPFSAQGGTDEAVSAAILARVLEERENERKSTKKFCIDIGTQTHGWSFPDLLPTTTADGGPQYHHNHHHRRSGQRTNGGSAAAAKASDLEGEPNSSSTTTTTSTSTSASKSGDEESDLDSEKLTEEQGEAVRPGSHHVSSILLSSSRQPKSSSSSAPSAGLNRAAAAPIVSYMPANGSSSGYTAAHTPAAASVPYPSVGRPPYPPSSGTSCPPTSEASCPPANEASFPPSSGASCPPASVALCSSRLLKTRSLEPHSEQATDPAVGSTLSRHGRSDSSWQHGVHLPPSSQSAFLPSVPDSRLCRTPSGASSTSSLFGSLVSTGGESLGMIRSLSSGSYSALQTDL